MFNKSLVSLAASLFTFIQFSCLYAQEFGGNPSSIKWNQINNKHSRIIFPQGLDSQANRINNLNKLLGNITAYSIGGKQGKWDIVLINQTTLSNALVRMAPKMSEFYMNPGQNNFSLGSIRWDDNLITHENRHIQQFSNFNKGLTRVFTFFLGQEGQLLANGLTIPDYFFEGDAVWQETLVSGQGRGRMPYFYNGMKSISLDNKKYSWMKLRSGSLKDYTPDHYELGYQVTAYGYEKHGADFWRKVTGDAVRFKGLFYAFNKAIERYSGITYPQFREDALRYFKERSIQPTGKNNYPFNFITEGRKNNVVDYLFPYYAGGDTIVVTKQSYNEVNAFYRLVNGVEQKVRVKDFKKDDYYSYRNGKIVYAGYQADPRWGNRDFSNIKILDVHTKKQRTLGFKSRYFSPDINEDGSEVLAVTLNPNGTNFLHRINAVTGELTMEIPNPNNYLFTQSKYIDQNSAVSSVRTPEGKMCLVKVNLTNGETERITPLSFNSVGYPFVKGDTIYFSAMNNNSDKIFAVTLSNKKIYQLTNNINGVYQPAVNTNGDMLFTAFTANGSMLGKLNLDSTKWKEVTSADFTNTPVPYTPSLLHQKGSGLLYTLTDTANTISRYKKGAHLFNFHSWRPEVADPEYSYNLYSNNVLSSFNTTASYTFNRADQSHTVGLYEAFAGWFPILRLGTEYSLNRSIDTAIGKSVQFNSGKLNAGLSIPLHFVGGRTSTSINFGGGYNLEQLYYRGIGKDVLKNKSLKYTNYFLSFYHSSQQARQHINPHWAQSFTLSYRDAFTLINSHKLVGNSSFYFPGLFTNHSLVIDASLQKRDSLPDLFSKTFSYSRGYEALSTRSMYKWGANYHFPLLYPDWGFGNIIFFQRVRANVFYDHTIARAKLNGVLTDIKNRSTGTEIYFDTKVWNALPVTFGFRYSHLLDKDLLNPTVKNHWEFIIPIAILPN